MNNWQGQQTTCPTSMPPLARPHQQVWWQRLADRAILALTGKSRGGWYGPFAAAVRARERAEGYKRDAAAWRERAIRAERELGRL